MSYIEEEGNSKARHMNRKWLYDLRGEAPPSDVKVFDLNGNLLRTEPPTFWFNSEGNFTRWERY